MLHTRKEVVTLVPNPRSGEAPVEVHMPPERLAAGEELESLLIPELIRRHGCAESA